MTARQRRNYMGFQRIKKENDWYSKHRRLDLTLRYVSIALAVVAVVLLILI